MTFADPILLVALLLIPVAILGYVLLQRRRSRYVVRFTNVSLLENLVPRRPAWRRHIPVALYLAAVAALAVALARPSMVVPVPREQATVILTMDTSRSMIATDVDPSRLAAAKAAATEFVDSLPAGFKVGLVAFSTEARLVLTPTVDRSQIHDAIDGLRADGGTALGDAIDLSLEAAGIATGTAAKPAAGSAASPAPSADPSASPDAAASPDPSAGSDDEGTPLTAMVVLSDGKSSTGQMDPLDAAAEAAQAGVPVYTIALGTDDGRVEVTDQFGQAQTIPVPPDPATLADIAEETGARFFQAPTSSDLQTIYQGIGSKVGFTNEEREVTQWFAAGALLLVLGGAGLAAFWFNRIP
jgi:Ca-activated chloride channel family protein